VGIRLAGDRPVVRDRDGELPSEGMVPGSVQVPPDGLPVLFLRDHAVTGGYPVIATVVPGDLDAAAQLAPGSTVTFRAVDPDPGTTDRIPQEKP
jgi:allophanate hydrolase subunit 2